MAQSPLPQGATQTDPLAQLRDIHLPAPIETWPPAPGWWLLAFLGIAILIAGIAWLYQRWARNRYRREGLKELETLLKNYQSAKDGPVYLADYSALLKRVALSRFPREQVASLTGEAWVQFLDRVANTDEFSMGAGQVLINGNYAPAPDIDVEALHELGEFWIKQHTLPNETGRAA